MQLKVNNRIDQQSLKSIVLKCDIVNEICKFSCDHNYEIIKNSPEDVTHKEVTFTYPIPDGFTVTDFHIKIGEKIIRSQLKKKAKAIQEYKQTINY